MDTAAQLSALPLLGLTLARVGRLRLSPQAWTGITLAAAAVALPLMQLIILPSDVWRSLAGRDAIERAFEMAGIPFPPLPLTLDPLATRAAALSLIPAVAVFLGTVQLDAVGRRRLSLVVVLFALACLPVVLSQLQLGAARSLALHETGSQLGFFANRNHLAALFYAAMPITAAWAIGLLVESPMRGRLGAVLLVLLYASFLLGLGMARSRAGLLLGGAAGAASLLIAWTATRRRDIARPVPLVVAGGILGLVLVLNFALLGILDRLETDLTEDYRFTILRFAVEAMRDLLPAGSGFGTFTPVYRMYEPTAALQTVYANHAHNDWLQLMIEGGLPAAILLAVGLFWFGLCVKRAWRNGGPGARPLDVAIRRAATIVVVLLLLHSVVDYPLRTMALMSVLALAAGLAVEPFPAAAKPPSEQSQEERDAKRGRSHVRGRQASADIEHTGSPSPRTSLH